MIAGKLGSSPGHPNFFILNSGDKYMTKFEYVGFSDCSISELDDLGSEGWEIITAKFKEEEIIYDGLGNGGRHIYGGWSGLAKRPKE